MPIYFRVSLFKRQAPGCAELSSCKASSEFLVKIARGIIKKGGKIFELGSNVFIVSLQEQTLRLLFITRGLVFLVVACGLKLGYNIYR